MEGLTVLEVLLRNVVLNVRSCGCIGSECDLVATGSIAPLGSNITQSEYDEYISNRHQLSSSFDSRLTDGVGCSPRHRVIVG